MSATDRDYSPLVEILELEGVEHWASQGPQGPMLFEVVTENLRIRWMCTPMPGEFSAYALDGRNIRAHLSEECLLEYMDRDAGDWQALFPELIIAKDGSWHFAAVTHPDQEYGARFSSVARFRETVIREAHQVSRWASRVLAGK